MRLRHGLCYVVAIAAGVGCQTAIAFLDLTGARAVVAFGVGIFVITLINLPLSGELRLRRGRPNGAS